MTDRPADPASPDPASPAPVPHDPLVAEVVDDEEWDDSEEWDEEPGANPLAALLGGGEEGGFDMGSLLDSAMQMQQQLMAAREEAAGQVLEGVSGGGLVRIEVTGGLEFRKVRIDPAAIDPDDLTLLEDLVLAALHDAVARANALQGEAMGGLGLPGL